LSQLKKITTIPFDQLQDIIGVKATVDIPNLKSLDLERWSMENGDSYILSAIYKAVMPRRHLEFGTWEGFGACLCLKNSNATVWTINLFEGETLKNRQWAYGGPIASDHKIPANAVMKSYVDEVGISTAYLRTDARGNIGHLYRDQNFGHRVNQIFCDSRRWHLKNYPNNFFDTVLIDGGHTKSIVKSDTKKALKVLRPGGLIIWHDFCPVLSVRSKNPHVGEVVTAVKEIMPILKNELTKLAWINPSWLLVGVKR
jgi:predicted O-methyltransferase YrrM